MFAQNRYTAYSEKYFDYCKVPWNQLANTTKTFAYRLCSEKYFVYYCIRSLIK